VTRLDAPVPAPCRDCPTNPAAPENGDSLTVRDLDGDTEPEVVVDLYTAGAHCCTYSQIYRWKDSDITYVRSKHNWRDAGYGFSDFDRDGLPEFRSGDARFAYEFTAYAFSVFPIQIWRFRDGHLRDVTRRFHRPIRRDAKANKKLYVDSRDKPDADVRGVLAAYAADKYLLGQGRSGWRVVRRALERGDVSRGYLRKLRRFLKRTGYLA